ncbi:MAG: LD-carboxypeptidase [Balneolaceae bacterium]|nr:LD-carboxypeptidase [Balneolaceae bacterium]
MAWSRNEFLKMIGYGSVSTLLPSGITQLSKFNSDEMVRPPRLRRGDVIGMISPASTLPPDTSFDKIIQTIQAMGFRVQEGSSARQVYGGLGGTDQVRAEDLNAMFYNPEINAIMPFRGGWGSNRILHMIDYDMIRRNPKPLIGFSDITSLLLSIYAKTGMVTFHGPFGKSIWNDFTTRHFKQMLMRNGQTTLENPPDAGITVQTISSGTARGKLLGGNLTVLTSMLGSDFLPEWEGSILFLEDIGEEPYRIDRMLTQLKLNGILDKLNGFIFGRCTNCESSGGQSLTMEQIFADHIKPLGVPAFYGSMIGHIDRMFTLPIGVNAEIHAETGSIKILESPTTT